MESSKNDSLIDYDDVGMENSDSKTKSEPALENELDFSLEVDNKSDVIHQNSCNDSNTSLSMEVEESVSSDIKKVKSTNYSLKAQFSNVIKYCIKF